MGHTKGLTFGPERSTKSYPSVWLAKRGKCDMKIDKSNLFCIFFKRVNVHSSRVSQMSITGLQHRTVGFAPRRFSWRGGPPSSRMNCMRHLNGVSDSRKATGKKQQRGIVITIRVLRDRESEVTRSDMANTRALRVLLVLATF